MEGLVLCIPSDGPCGGRLFAPRATDARGRLAVDVLGMLSKGFRHVTGLEMFWYLLYPAMGYAMGALVLGHGRLRLMSLALLARRGRGWRLLRWLVEAWLFALLAFGVIGVGALPFLYYPTANTWLEAALFVAAAVPSLIVAVRTLQREECQGRSR